MSIPKSHYFEARPAVPSRPRTLRLDLELQSDRGVFGSKGIDAGTLILLKEAPPPPAVGDILDLGAGYGPIAVTLARRAPEAHVWAVDVNERAVELAQANAATAGVTNVTAGTPDTVPPISSSSATSARTRWPRGCGSGATRSRGSSRRRATGSSRSTEDLGPRPARRNGRPRSGPAPRAIRAPAPAHCKCRARARSGSAGGTGTLTAGSPARGSRPSG